MQICVALEGQNPPGFWECTIIHEDGHVQIDDSKIIHIGNMEEFHKCWRSYLKTSKDCMRLETNLPFFSYGNDKLLTKESLIMKWTHIPGANMSFFPKRKHIHHTSSYIPGLSCPVIFSSPFYVSIEGTVPFTPLTRSTTSSWTPVHPKEANMSNGTGFAPGMNSSVEDHVQIRSQSSQNGVNMKWSEIIWFCAFWDSVQTKVPELAVSNFTLPGYKDMFTRS